MQVDCPVQERCWVWRGQQHGDQLRDWRIRGAPAAGECQQCNEANGGQLCGSPMPLCEVEERLQVIRVVL